MNIDLLWDPRLLFIMAISAVVSMLTTLNVAARPAAVASRQVATAFTISSLFFMLTRFANLFYLPLMAHFTQQAVNLQRTDQLYDQIEWVIAASAVGALGSWLLLPTFVELYERGVRSLMRRGGSMMSVLMRLRRPGAWKTIAGSLRAPGNLGTRLFHLEGVPWDFLAINVVATAIWTVGALCAIYVSGISDKFAATALLLSGLVNGLAAIAFSVFVDPKASLITDQAVNALREVERRVKALAVTPGAVLAGRDPLGLDWAARSERRVRITAVHLAAGNFLGACLGLAVFDPGTRLVHWATVRLGEQGDALVDSLWLVVLLNVLVILLASTTVSARVSAVLTRQVASALAIYNFFFLITRLAGQVYAPVLGAIRDSVKAGKAPDPAVLEPMFRWILAGAAVGALLGWLLMPTFIAIYNRAIGALQRTRSIAAIVLMALWPGNWPKILACLRPPSFLGITREDVRSLPKPFLWGNMVVISVHTVGVMAAIYAGAQNHELARTATLLSPVVNGIATILLSILVDPRVAVIVDQAIAGKRTLGQVNAMAVLLMAGMFVGTLLSQVLFQPAAWAILRMAQLVDWVF